MDPLSAVVLGVVQGLTEFLPVSSSGHLVLVQHLLGIAQPQVLFDVVVHLGTLLAVVVATRQELAAVVRGVLAWTEAVARRRAGGPHAPESRLAAWVAIGTLPAAVAGLAAAPRVEELFGSVRGVGVALLVTAVLLLAAERAPAPRAGLWELGARRAVVVGVAQAVAIVPGISRSGSTIAAGVLAGVDREAAARFSFLLAVPTIAGAGLVAALQGASGELASPGAALLALGFGSAAVSGYLAIRFLLVVLRRGSLRWFAAYVAAAALVALVGAARGG